MKFLLKIKIILKIKLKYINLLKNIKINIKNKKKFIFKLFIIKNFKKKFINKGKLKKIKNKFKLKKVKLFSIRKL